MRFTRGDDWHAVSECGRYTIARIVRGPDLPEQYEAFRGRVLLTTSDKPKAEAWAHCVAACKADKENA